MEKALFLGAFFAVVWLIYLILYWVTTISDPMDRISAKQKCVYGIETKGAYGRVLQYLFVISNAHVLYPVRGVVVAILLILLFVMYKRII